MSEVPLTISAGRPSEPSGARLVLTLALAGMLSGLALAGAHTLTKPTIDANKARALRRAVLKVVPGSASMRRLVVQGGRLVPDDDGDAGGEAVYAAYDEAGVFLGYAIANEGPGFQDTIRLIYGFDPGRKLVVGMEVLESRETPGLGDKIYKDEAFVGNFAALAVEPAIALVKGGRTAEHEVDAITGATISSRAVVSIIRTAEARWRPLLPETPPPPPLPDAPPDAPPDAAPAPTAGGEGG